MGLYVLSRPVQILRKEGLTALAVRALHFVYFGYLRDRLPRRTVEYNGQTVRAARLLDGLIPGIPLDKPEYESGIVAGLREQVEPGDDIVIVGGGWGVTPAVAATLTGSKGTVTVYEGAQQNVEFVRETAERNGVADIVTVEHAIVGPEIELRGEAGDPDRLAATDLPDCDVLELDCEGAEIQILSSLSIQPPTIIVESHGLYGAPSNAVVELLTERGYQLISKTVADKRLSEYHADNDVFALVARQTGS